MKTILAVAGDPGGAAALAPVIEHLHREREVRMNALAYGEAVQLWRAASFPWTPLPAQADERELEDLARDCSLLLAGTSGPNGVDYEKRLTRLFRKLGRPSLVVLDYWANYGRRFADENGRLIYVPDRVAAIDEESRQGLIASGIPDDRIVITGHPGFDNLAAAARAFSAERKKQIREELGVAGDEIMVLFAAHPATILGQSGRASAELQAAIDCVTGVLEQIAQAHDRRFRLIIRPHPKDSKQHHPPRHLSCTRIRWTRAGDPREVALAADAVLGTTTMLLVEAHLMGCPTISLQLSTGAAPAGFGPRLLSCTNRSELHHALECLTQALTNGSCPAHSGRAPTLQSAATEKVTALIHNLIEKSGA